MNYQHIIFDLDGTLVDSATEIHEAAEFVCKKHGLSLPTKNYIREKTGNPPAQFFLDHGCEPSNADTLVEIFRRRLADYAGNPECVYPGVHDVLVKISCLGKRISLATTKPTKLATILLQRYGLSFYFEHIQGTDPPLKHKPHPDIILACISHAPNLPAIMVGDTTFDIQAATQAGINSVAFSEGSHGKERLIHSNPSFIISHMNQLLPVLGIEQ